MFSTDSSIPAFLDLDGCLRSYLNHLRHKCSCWKYCGIIVTKMFRLEILRHNCYKNVHVRNIVAQLLQNFRCCGDCGAVLGSISSKICAANPAMSNSIIWVIGHGMEQPQAIELTFVSVIQNTSNCSVRCIERLHLNCKTLHPGNLEYT